MPMDRGCHPRGHAWRRDAIVPETCPTIDLSEFPSETGLLDGDMACPANDRLLDSGVGAGVGGGLKVIFRTQP